MYSAVFQSPSRLRMACEHGLRALFAVEQLHDVAGILCDVPTFLAAQGLQVTDACIRYAAASGNLALLELLHIEQGVPLPANVGHGAAARAQMNVLQWLLEVGFALGEDTANAASADGQADVLLWLLQHMCPVNVMRLCGTAAYYGNINILDLLQEQDLLPAPQLLSDVLQVAGLHGQLAAAQWVRQRGAEWPPMLQDDGRTWQGEVLAWARAEGCTSPIAAPFEEDDDEDCCLMYAQQMSFIAEHTTADCIAGTQ
eukprot:16258-Heterococcus_DN1.PRE.1